MLIWKNLSKARGIMAVTLSIGAHHELQPQPPEPRSCICSHTLKSIMAIVRLGADRKSLQRPMRQMQFMRCVVCKYGACVHTTPHCNDYLVVNLQQVMA